MEINSRAGWFLSLVSSISLGVLSAVLYDDIWFGGVVTALVGIILLGAVNSPDEVASKLFHNQTRWHSLFGIVTVLVMMTPLMSDILLNANVYATMLFLWTILICGVVIGTRIERSNTRGD